MGSLKEVYGKAERKLFLVQWADHPGEDSWLPEHALLRDGCKQSIDDFWLITGKNPARDFYHDKHNKPHCLICGWASKSTKFATRCLKAHITRSGHKWNKERVKATANRDAILKKQKDRQQALPKVKWGDKDIDNN